MTTMVASFVVPRDHPSLAGHFPNEPIVPGVVALDHVCALLLGDGANPITLNVKFIRPVLPGETIAVTAQAAGHQIAFSALCRGEPVLSGTFEVTG